MINIKKFSISLAIPLIAGFIGSFFTSSSVNAWYTTLNKPSFNPPNWLFAPVWTILFIMIGISFYMAWSKGFSGQKRLPVTIYSLNLLLNLAWSLLFFGLKAPLIAFIEIIILWIVILINIIVFYRISRTSGILLIPYLLWVSFASILNYFIFHLN